MQYPYPGLSQLRVEGCRSILALAMVTTESVDHQSAALKLGQADGHKHKKRLYTVCISNVLVFLEGTSFFSLLAPTKGV